MKPLISLCLIVKNEEANIGRCLESAKGLADETIIVDTGSTDRTVEVCRAYGATVFHMAWADDFAAARNYGLERAVGSWVLVLDADDEIAAKDRSRVRGLAAAAAEDVEGFFFQTVSYVGDQPGEDVVVCPHLRLFRNRPERRYVGAIHEYLAIAPGERLAHEAVQVFHYGYLTPEVRGREKIRRNLTICRNVARRHPDDPSAHFHLGTEHIRAGAYAKALDSYRRAARLARGAKGGWVPELVKKTVLGLTLLDRVPEALEEVDQGVRTYPDYTDLHFLRAGLLQQLGDLNGAAQGFRRCLAMGEAPFFYPSDLGVGSFKAAFGLGHTLQIMGSHEAAVQAYLAALQANPRFQPALDFLVGALEAWKGSDHVRQALLGLIDASGGSTVRLAEALMSNGLYGDALAVLGGEAQPTITGAEARPEVRDEPPNQDRIRSQAHRALLAGLCRLGMGDVPAATAWLAAIPPAAGTAYRQAQLNLCLCAWLEDRPEVARAVLARLKAEDRVSAGKVVRDPTLMAYEVFTRLLLSPAASGTRGRLPGAARAAAVNLAEKLAEMGATEKALLALSLSEPAAGGAAEASRVARMLARHGDLDSAAALLERGVAACLTVGEDGPVDPSGPDWMGLLAEIELRRGNRGRAAGLYRLLLQVHPWDVKAILGLAKAIQQQGQHWRRAALTP